MNGIQHVAVLLCGLALGWGCGSDDASGPTVSAPTISNLIVSTGPNRTLVFQMGAADPDADLIGGHCTLTAAGFTGTPTMTVASAVPPNPATPLTVTCTLSVPSQAAGQSVGGTISISDARGNASNQLAFSATLPERRRGSS